MTAVAPQIIVSDDQWYLEHVLPWPQGEEDGFIIVSHTMGKGHWVDEAVCTSLEALAAIRRRAADPRTVGVFTSQARMRPHDRRKRSADLACAFDGVWLDLDAKDFGKPEESIVDKFDRIVKELKAFRRAVTLPFPSVLVWSGGGMHAYWLTATIMSKAQWMRLSAYGTPHNSMGCAQTCNAPRTPHAYCASPALRTENPNTETVSLSR
jgi:hypothetical protein